MKKKSINSTASTILEKINSIVDGVEIDGEGKGDFKTQTSILKDATSALKSLKDVLDTRSDTTVKVSVSFEDGAEGFAG